MQTYLLKNAQPGRSGCFIVSGTGSMPREQQQGGGRRSARRRATGRRSPGGGIGEPINQPDPLTKYKWWILGGLGLVLATAAAFLLRKPARALRPARCRFPPTRCPAASGYSGHVAIARRQERRASHALKEELFSLESEKISGTLNVAEYAEQKAALEVVLKRALKKSS